MCVSKGMTIIIPAGGGVNVSVYFFFNHHHPYDQQEEKHMNIGRKYCMASDKAKAYNI